MSLILLKDLEHRTALALIAQAKAQKQEFTPELTELEEIVFTDELQIALWDRLSKTTTFANAHGHASWLKDVLMGYIVEDGILSQNSHYFNEKTTLTSCARDEMFRRIQKLTDEEVESMVLHEVEAHAVKGTKILRMIAESPVDLLIRSHPTNITLNTPKLRVHHSLPMAAETVYHRHYSRRTTVTLGLSSCSFSDGRETWLPRQYQTSYPDDDGDSVVQIEAKGRNIVKVSRYDENGDFVSSFTLTPSLPRTSITAKEIKAYEHRFKHMGLEPEKKTA